MTDNNHELLKDATNLMFAQSRKVGRTFRLPPYVLATKLGITTDEARKIVKRLCDDGVIAKTAKGFEWRADLL
jgi:ribosomal protein S25